jgi:hypothetical protein
MQYLTCVLKLEALCMYFILIVCCALTFKKWYQLTLKVTKA